MNSNPLISIIIPTYNRSALLRRALNSLAKQTYKNFEVIIVDDASKENNEDVVNSTNLPNIIYHKNDKNQGEAKVRNTGLKIAKGEYRAFLDDDDEFLPEKLEVQLKTAVSLPKETFILCNGEYVGGDRGRYAYDIDKSTGFIDPGKQFFPMSYKLPPPSSWFFHRSLMEQIGYFDENLARWVDSDYSVRLVQKYPVYMLNKLLVIWHVTPGSITMGGVSKVDVISRKQFLLKHFDLIKKDTNYAYRFCWRLGKDFRKMGMIREAKDCFTKAWVIKPYKFEALGQLLSACCKMKIYEFQKNPNH